MHYQVNVSDDEETKGITLSPLTEREQHEYHLRMHFNAWCYDRDNWIAKYIDSWLKKAYLKLWLAIYDLRHR